MLHEVKLIKEKWFFNLMRCPDCGGNLALAGTMFCGACQFSNLIGTDLRMQSPSVACVSLTLPRKLSVDVADLLQQIDTTKPTITFDGPAALRDSRELMSEVADRLPSGGAALDLGCGPRDQALPLGHLGFRYVGVDFSNPAADLLADAHSIPFKDGSFDCVFSYAVLEHLHNPFIALHEVARVLKPGAWFIGTVSQGEPFHSSYFHHTPWALVSLVAATPGLRLARLWDSVDTLQSLASMGRYSRVIKLMLAAVDWIARHFPWLAPRKMRWSDKEKQLDRLYRAGSVCFAIQSIPVNPVSSQICAE